MLAPLAAERRVWLRLDASEPGLACAIDRDQLQQAVTNLVVNGLQAIGRDGTIEIALSRRCAASPDARHPESNCAVITVSDTGTGIAADVLPHIFEPFFTSKDVGEGTGLGLSVTYGIVREHDGWIAVTSTSGYGSRFSLFLPLDESRSETHRETP